MLTEQERISLLMMRGMRDRKKSYAHVTELSKLLEIRTMIYLNRPVINTVQHFEETEFIKDRMRQDRLTIATNSDKKLNILQLYFLLDSHKSICKAAQQHDIAPMSVHNILKKEKFHPYKIRLVQKLCKVNCVK